MKFVFFLFGFRSCKLSVFRWDFFGFRYDKKYLVFGEKIEDGMYEVLVMYLFV